ncbi:MAG: tetratricopeptide repeat protein [Prevotella sp.]|nr:tetratricopeptide repeat protein [Prevotella sp.]
MKRILFLLLLILSAGTGVSAQRFYDAYFLEAMLERQKGHHDAAFSLLTRCQQINPQASEAYYFLAQYYTEMKDADKALDYFLKASQLEPGNATYMETLAQAYIGKNQFAEAIKVVEELYELDKSRQELLDMLYKLHMRQREYDKAISVLDRMELIDGKSERLSLTKSSLYFQMGDQEASLREVKALSEQFPNDLNYRTIYANSLMLGSGDNMDERRQLARKILTEVLAEEPKNYSAQAAMRAYYLGERDTLRADSLTRSILLNPETALEDKVSLLRQEIGYSEAHGGDSTRILNLFREMLDMPEPSADIAEFCAAYMNMKQMPRDSVSRMLHTVLRLSPDNATARLQLVQYAWEDNDNAEVVSLCQSARLYNPDEMAFYYYQGMAFYRQDDYDHALEAFQNGISVITEESNPAIVSDFYAVMGDLLHQKGRQREAFEAYDSCLQWKPDNIGCLNNYAYYLSELGVQLDKAERMSSLAIKAEPENGTYLDTYAWILFMQKRYEEALVYINKAVASDSLHSSVILEHAGDINAMNGHIDEAVNLWQEALKGDPDNKILNRKIRRKKYIK